MDDSIYIEAILFVTVFGLMSIISIIVSKKNAKKYELENPIQDRRKARKKEQLQKELDDMPIVAKKDSVTKLLQLSKMLEDGTISEKEFQVLKKELLD